ncbi:MAG: NfeD family protein [Thermoplasmata archaeon]|nr:NfeD family protein [Thermoplasmata archaeon]
MWTELGTTLIIIGLLLFVIELSSPGFFIGIPATVLIALGLMAIIFQERVNTWPAFFLVVIISVITFYYTMRFYQRLAPPEERLTHVTAADSLVGRKGTVLKEVDHETIKGSVMIQGQIYAARAYENEVISPKIKVRVVDSKGVHVVVKELENQMSKKIIREG